MPKLSSNKRQERMDNILDSAFYVFSEKGYASSTIDDIVKKSNVSKGGIYHHFASKEEIFFAIAENRFKMRLSEISNYKNRTSILDFIEGYISNAFRNIKNESTIRSAKFSFEFWSLCTRDETLKSKAQEHYAKYLHAFREVLNKGVAIGELPQNIDIDAAIFILLSTLDGLTYTNIVMGIDIPEHTAELSTTIIKQMLTTAKL